MIHATIAQALYATRLFNVTITNVPGPQQTLYAFGAPLREIHPLVPLAAEHAVGVAAASYDGSVFFGVVADRDTVPDLDVLLSALERLGPTSSSLRPARTEWPQRTALPAPRAEVERLEALQAADLAADSNVDERMVVMTDSVYRVTEVIGVSSESWEAAARSAVETAAKTVRDLRIAEVVRQDVAIENGTIKSYRVRLAISFKYESSD